MQKLIRYEKLLFWLAVSSAAVGTLAIAGIIFFIWKLWYVPMAVCVLLAAHGFYGCPLYLMRRTDTKLCRLILSAAEEGVCGAKALGERAGVKSEFAEKLISRLIKN